MFIYRLINSHYDIIENILLGHQKEYSSSEFKSLCDSLIPRAMDLVLESEPNNDCIGWDDIVKALATILVHEKNFVKYEPTTVSYDGGIIWGNRTPNGISNGFNVDRIIERNKEF